MTMPIGNEQFFHRQDRTYLKIVDQGSGQGAGW